MRVALKPGVSGAEIERANARLAAARRAVVAHRSAETMAESRAAWAAVEALYMPPPASGYASRAGRRQAAERRQGYR